MVVEQQLADDSMAVEPEVSSARSENIFDSGGRGGNIEEFARRHNIDTKQPITIQFSICNATGDVPLLLEDEDYRKLLDLLHQKLHKLPEGLRGNANAKARGRMGVSARTCGSHKVWVPNSHATPLYRNQVGAVGQNVEVSKNLKDQFKNKLCQVSASCCRRSILLTLHLPDSSR